MQIRVMLFGPAALAQGEGEILLDLDGPALQPARAVLDAIAAQHPSLTPYTTTGRLAVNGRYAAGELTIGPEDEIALIAMVSGG